MAHSLADFEGWCFYHGNVISLSSDDETTSPRRGSPRLTRGKSQQQRTFKDDPTNITIKRESDDLELSVGDCLLYNTTYHYHLKNRSYDKGKTTYGLIKSIIPNTNDYMEVTVIWFVDKAHVLEALKSGKKECPISLKHIEDNEIFMTAEMSKIKVEHIIKKIEVFSPEKYKHIREKNKEIFICQRAIDSFYLSETFQYEGILEEIFRASKFLPFMQDLLYDKNKTYLKSIGRELSNVKKPTSPKKSYKGMDDDAEDSDSSIELISGDEDWEDEEPNLKKKRATRKTSRATNNITPKKRKLKKINETTPSIPSRVIGVKKEIEEANEVEEEEKEELKEGVIFKNAKAKLHTSALLASLPCREDEFAQIYLTLESLISEEMGSCIYISGTPGTGKTATVRKVIDELIQRRENNQLINDLMKAIEEKKTSRISRSQRIQNKSKVQQPITEDLSIEQLENQLTKMQRKIGRDKSLEQIKNFDYVEINGLKLISPNSCYEILWEKISGNRVAANTAKNLIEYYLMENDPNRAPLVVLMDEMDQIITKNQSIMYNFFNWPTYQNSKLIVIAIANTMDLPERALTNKISSRLGLSRLLFPGYTHEQLCTIIESRLSNMNKKSDNLKKLLKFEKTAVEFASRKVASVSGDARRGLSICRRSVEIAEQDYLKKEQEQAMLDQPIMNDEVYYVKITHIIKAIQETTFSPISLYVLNLPVIGKIFLVALIKRIKKNGYSEVEFNDLIDEMKINLNFLDGGQVNLKSQLNSNIGYLDDFFTSSKMMGLDFIINQLISGGIVTREYNKANQSKLVKLCISSDDVDSALRKEKMFQKLLG